MLSVVCRPEMAGSGIVSQHIPPEITADPPSPEIFPPDIALVYEISVAEAVTRKGTVTCIVVNDISLP